LIDAGGDSASARIFLPLGVLEPESLP